ncbi:MAG: glycosyltransferase [Alkalispirochaeta sp.]
MHRLVFDLIALQPEGTSPVSGGGEYTRRVFLTLVDHAIESGRAESITAVASAGAPLDPLVREAASRAGIPIRRVGTPEEVGALLAEVGATRFFSALPLRYAAVIRRMQATRRVGGSIPRSFVPEGCQFVYTVHGLRALELPSDRDELRYATSLRAVGRYLVPRLARRWYLARRRAQFRRLFSLAQDQQIITVSDHSRHSILSTFPELAGGDTPIHTLYSPAATDPARGAVPVQGSIPSAGDNAVIHDLTPRGFYLVITANRWGKNGARAVDALLHLYETGLLKRKTVLVGIASHGRQVPYIRRLRSHPRADRFVLLDYLPREDLQRLYARARALVFPTLNEGFGYPPLECMAAGTPVITSGINSIPELVGDAALLCNPWSVSEIAARVLQIEREPETVARLQEAGPRRAAHIRAHQERMLTELVALLMS